MHYLTVQDLLWVNLEITESVQPFHYASLEDAAYCQYGYGNSQRLVEQAARLAWEFPRKAPFDQGNAATTFAAMVAFAELNGLVFLREDDAATVAWAQSLTQGERPNPDAVSAAFRQGPEPESHPDDLRHLVRSALKSVLTRYPTVLRTLRDRERDQPRAVDVRDAKSATPR